MAIIREGNQFDWYPGFTETGRSLCWCEFILVILLEESWQPLFELDASDSVLGIMADAEEMKKKRTFRKYSYRGALCDFHDFMVCLVFHWLLCPD